MPTFLNVEVATLDIKNQTPRFFYQNLMNAGNSSMTNSVNGVVTRPQAVRAGYAELACRPSPVTLQSDAHYVVEIDSVVEGTTIGAATFRYGREFFDYSGLTYLGYEIPTGTNITLLPDLKISFYEGITEPSFYAGDRWTFDVIAFSSLEKGLDGKRDTFVSCIDSSTVISVDLSDLAESDREVDSLIIYDHEMDEDAFVVWAVANELYTFTLDASPFPWKSSRKAVYLDAPITYPYHTITIDASASNGDLQIGNIYLGKYLRLDRRRNIEHTRSRNVVSSSNDPSERFIQFDQEKVEFSFSLMQGLEDGSDLMALYSLISDTVGAGFLQKSLFVHFNPTDQTDIELYFVENLERPRANRYINVYDVPIVLVEVPKP